MCGGADRHVRARPLPSGRCPGGVDVRTEGHVVMNSQESSSVHNAQVSTVVPGGIHHVELWVPDLDRAVASFGWLLGSLGYEPFQDWPAGKSWRRGGHYIVLEQSPALTAADHDRLRPGLNHLAFHAGPPADVDRLVTESAGHGWQLMFEDRHPHAGGPNQYAAYLENDDGFEVELVAVEAVGEAP